MYVATLLLAGCVLGARGWSPVLWEKLGPWEDSINEVMGYYEKRSGDSHQLTSYRRPQAGLQDLTYYMGLLQALHPASLSEHAAPTKRQNKKKAKPCYWSLVSCYRRRKRSVESRQAR